MWAALRLRLVEARRRGGAILVTLAFLGVCGTAIWGGATPDGRYGLASDLAVTLAYVLAILFGTVPMAIDRERRRSYLPSASPVTPWNWALGNALGAAVVAGATALLLLVAAGLGTAMSGGIETRAVTRIASPRPISNLPLNVRVPKDARKLRLAAVTELRNGNAVGSSFAAELEVDGKTYSVHPGLPVVVPIHSEVVKIRSVNDEYLVGLLTNEIRALGAERSFLLNSIGVAAGPALGCAAVAAIGAAIGANLSAAVAALLAVLILLLASMKGFLNEAIAHEGGLRQTHGHAHGAADVPTTSVARDVSKTILRGVLVVLPEIDEFDRTDRVATGEWTALRGSGKAALVFAITLVVAGALGAVGVHVRRTP